MKHYPDSLETIDDRVRTFIAGEINTGFASDSEIIENATLYAEEMSGHHDVQTEIERITTKLLAAHQREQSGWNGPTDCDRLDEAFASLNKLGIVARQNFSCCNTCGFREIWDDVEEEETRQAVIGYVFYHLQCTEQAMQTGQLLMAYGCVDDNPETFRRVANTIVVELRRAGLNASWQGTDEHPIIVDNIVWRRRRPA